MNIGTRKFALLVVLRKPRRLNPISIACDSKFWFGRWESENPQEQPYKTASERKDRGCECGYFLERVQFEILEQEPKWAPDENESEGVPNNKE
jgi:hypothetical protein